jgi:hypothetical protein
MVVSPGPVPPPSPPPSSELEQPAKSASVKMGAHSQIRARIHRFAPLAGLIVDSTFSDISSSPERDRAGVFAPLSGHAEDITRSRKEI